MEGPRTEDRGQRTADHAEGGLRQGPGHLVVRKYSHAAPLEQIHSPTDLRLGCLGTKLSFEVCRKGLALERSGVLSAEQLGSDFLDSIRGIEWRMWHAISGWLTFAGFGTHWGHLWNLLIYHHNNYERRQTSRRSSNLCNGNWMDCLGQSPGR